MYLEILSNIYQNQHNILFYILSPQFVITVDDENENSGGNLIMAASLATPPAMSFVLNHGSGIICVGMKEEDLGRLNLLVTSSKHKDPSNPAYTTSMVCHAMKLAKIIL